MARPSRGMELGPPPRSKRAVRRRRPKRPAFHPLEPLHRFRAIEPRDEQNAIQRWRRLQRSRRFPLLRDVARRALAQYGKSLATRRSRAPGASVVFFCPATNAIAVGVIVRVHLSNERSIERRLKIVAEKSKTHPNRLHALPMDFFQK